MFKRAAVLFICLMVLTVAAANAEEPFAAPDPASPLTLEGDMGLLVENTWYPILNDFTPLKEALGEAEDIIAAPSCVFQGEDKEFVYDGMSVFTNPLGALDVWYEVCITGEGYTTVRGIGVGSSRNEIIAAYGQNYYMEGENVMTFSVSGIEGDYESPCVMFELTEDGLVSCIDIYFPTNTF